MTSAFRESKWPQRIVRVRQLLSTLRRVVVIGAVLGAVYFAIASLLYPDWSFEFVWRKSFLNLNDGWLVGLDEIKAHPYTVSLLLAALFCASLILRRFKTSLLPLADRIWAWLVSGALLTFLITTLLIYASESETHDLLDHAIALDEETIRIVNEQLTPKRPNIRPPIDFLYMNRHSVEALYNEIEPELIEKRRTIASSGKSEAKAGVTGSGVSAEFAATKGKESTASMSELNLPLRASAWKS